MTQVTEQLEKVNKFMTASMSRYDAPRAENELNLVDLVRQRLVNSGLGDRLSAAYDNNRFIIEAQGKTSIAQQYNLNRYLAIQFMAAQQDSLMQRYTLIYEVLPAQWLAIFDRTILPALMEFDLPVVV